MVACQALGLSWLGRRQCHATAACAATQYKDKISTHITGIGCKIAGVTCTKGSLKMCAHLSVAARQVPQIEAHQPHWPLHMLLLSRSRLSVNSEDAVNNDYC